VLSYSWNNRLELVSATPKLAIKWYLWQFSNPLWRSKCLIAISCVHCFTIPVASYTVQFLTHQPASRIMSIWVVCLGKHYIDCTTTFSFICRTCTQNYFINFLLIINWLCNRSCLSCRLTPGSSFLW
jgi:hypothetical protein